MCKHASWMDERLCTRCNLRPQNKVIQLGPQRTELSNRMEPISSAFTPRAADAFMPPVLPEYHCVGCKREVNPGFCYRGSVLSDLIHSTLLTSATTPVLGIAQIEVLGRTKEVVIGGHTVTGKKQIAFRKRTKGLLCDRCASNITRVSDGKGGTVPVVETEAFGESGAHARTGELKPHGKRGPVFNTRYTQGRRGKRV